MTYQEQPSTGPQITSSGLRAFQIALLMIFGAHIADGAITSRHISDGTINATEMFADGVVSYDKLDGNLKAKIDSELPYTTSNRVPTAADDASNTSGATWEIGTAASRRAKWLYKPDGSTSADWEVYECVDATDGAAVWTLTTLSAEDLSDLAFKTQAQLEQDITLAISNTTGLQTALDGKVNLAGSPQTISSEITFTGNTGFDGYAIFESGAQFNDEVIIDGRLGMESQAIDTVGSFSFSAMTTPALVNAGTAITSSSDHTVIATNKSVYDFLTSGTLMTNAIWEFEEDVYFGNGFHISGDLIQVVDKNLSDGSNHTSLVTGQAVIDYITGLGSISSNVSWSFDVESQFTDGLITNSIDVTGSAQLARVDVSTSLEFDGTIFDGVSTDLTSSATATQFVTAEAAKTYADSKVFESITRVEEVNVSTTDATELVYTTGGQEVYTFLFRNNALFAPTHDAANKKYTFDALANGETVKMVRVYTNA